MCRSKADATTQRERGFVLLASLWVMVLLGVLLATMSYQVRVEAALERRFIDRSILRLAARGAIHTAMARISSHREDWHSEQDEWWATEQHWRDIGIGDVLVDIMPTASLLVPIEKPETRPLETTPLESKPFYGPVDGESRLNINAASVDQLAKVPGLSAEIALKVAELRDQRQADYDAASGQAVVPPAASAEEADVVQLVDGPLISIEAVLVQAGLDLQVAAEQGISYPELLTTISSGRININTASVDVLASTGLTRDQIADVVSLRTAKPIESEAQIQSVLGSSGDVAQSQLLEMLDVKSATFHISAWAKQINRDEAYLVEAVVFNDGERLRVVQWVEQGDRKTSTQVTKATSGSVNG